MKSFTLRIRNKAFRNNNIDDMGISVITGNEVVLMEEIVKCVMLGNIDFTVEVNEVEDKEERR